MPAGLQNHFGKEKRGQYDKFCLCSHANTSVAVVQQLVRILVVHLYSVQPTPRAKRN